MTTTLEPKPRGFVGRVDRLYADPLRLTAAVAGWWWTSNLVIGVFLSHDFATSTVDGANVDLLFVPVAVNGWHALAHGIGGILGLVAARKTPWSAVYVGLLALIYVGWGSAGLASGQDTMWIFYGDTFGNWVHLAEGTILGTVLIAVSATDHVPSPRR